MSKNHAAMLLLVSLLAASCAGSGRAPEGEAARMRVTLRDYKGGKVFELVSESHTDRVAYYSSARNDASRKIQTDEVMDALLDELDRRGFEGHRQDGRAPSSGGAVITWGFEVQRGERTDHWVVGKGSAIDEWKEFQDCQTTFLQLYNVTASFQAIDNPSGKEIFQEPRRGRT